MAYKRYEKYKGSGIKYIGEIPEQWNIKKINYITSYIGSGKTPKGGSEIYTDEGIMLLRSQNIHFDELKLNDVAFITEEINSEMLNTQVNGNDILLNITGASIGRCNIVPGKFPKANVNQHVCIIRPDTRKVMPKLLNKIISSELIQNQILMCQTGSSREGLNFSQIRDLKVCIPTNIEEQKILVDYLDKKVNEVDQLIKDKNTLVKLLKEQRQAIIIEAVTKGLDKNVKMKDSGVQWIGNIPEYWIISSLKYVSDIIMGQSPDSKDVNKQSIGIPFLQGNADFGDKVPLNYENYCSSASKYSRKGDILMSVRAPVGAMNISSEIFAIGRGLCAIKATKVSVDYLWYLLSVVREELFSKSKGSTYDSVTAEDVKNIVVIIPKLKEQQNIAKFLDRKTNEIDNLMIDIDGSIDILKEYKQSLISEVVTGKIDIREL